MPDSWLSPLKGYEEIQDDGTPLVHRSKLKLPAGAAVDNPGGETTDVTFIVSSADVAEAFSFALSGVYDLAIVPGYFDPPRLCETARTIVSVSIIRRTAGTSGTTRCDVLKNGVSIFSGAGTMPQVTAAAGDNASQTVTAFVGGAAACAAGVRLDVRLEEVETYLAGPPEGPEGFRVVIRFA